MDRDALIEEASRNYRNAEGEYRMRCVLNTPADPVEAEKALIEFRKSRQRYIDTQAEFHRLWGY